MKNLKDIIESQNFLVNRKLQNRQIHYNYQNFIDYIGDCTQQEIKIIDTLDERIEDFCKEKYHIDDLYRDANGTALEAFLEYAWCLVQDKSFRYYKYLGTILYRKKNYGTHNIYDYIYCDNTLFEFSYHNKTYEIDFAILIKEFCTSSKDNENVLKTFYDMIERHPDKLDIDNIDSLCENDYL